MKVSICDVRFTRESGHLRRIIPCPLSANSGHRNRLSAPCPPLDELGAKTLELVVGYRARFL